ncbi:hypothetical protein LEMLEM_LOCUS27871 [Lemmus lemmus]
MLGNRRARSRVVLPIGGFRRRGRRAGIEAGLGGLLRSAIGRPLGGGGAARAEALEQPEGAGATAGLGAGSGGGVAQEGASAGCGRCGGYSGGRQRSGLQAREGPAGVRRWLPRYCRTRTSSVNSVGYSEPGEPLLRRCEEGTSFGNLG